MTTEHYDKLLNFYKRAARLTLEPEKLESEILTTKITIDKAYVKNEDSSDLEHYCSELEFFLYEILPLQKI